MVRHRHSRPLSLIGEGGAHERSQRQRRVGEALRHALAAIFRDGACRDPALQEVSITVTEVRVSPDLRNASAFVMPLGGANVREAMAGLDRCAGFLKGRLARTVSLRFTPSLSFHLDPAFEQADRINRLLARPEVARDLAAPGEHCERGDAG